MTIISSTAAPACEPEDVGTTTSALRSYKVASAFVERPPRLLRRNSLDHGVIVPGIFGFLRFLDLEQIHVVKLPAVGTDRPFAKKRIIRRQLLHLVDDGFAVGRSAVQRIDRSQIMQGRAINAGLQSGRIAVVAARNEALAPCARLVIEVPIKRLGELQALSNFQAQRMNVAEIEHHRDHALTTAAYSELDRLLDRVDGIAAGVDQCDDLP